MSSTTIDRPIDRPSPNASPDAPAAVPGSAFTVDTDLDPAARVRSRVPPEKVSTEESPTEAVAEISTRLNASEPGHRVLPATRTGGRLRAEHVRVIRGRGRVTVGVAHIRARLHRHDLPNSCAPAPRPALVVANAKFKPTAAPTVSPVAAPVVTA